MSRARELALLEKWTDAATATVTDTFPPLASPTSPKATKFCCCPNRRRYNLKHPKVKSTLDARNIFLDNDFSYIDDEEQQRDNSSKGNNTHNHIHSNGNGNNNSKCGRSSDRCSSGQQNGSKNRHYANGVAAIASVKGIDNNKCETSKWQQIQQQQQSEKLGNTTTNYADDYDDICDVVDNAGNCRNRLMNAQQQQQQQQQNQLHKLELAKQCHKADQLQQWWHDKGCHNNSHEQTNTNNKNNNNCKNNSNSDSNICDSKNQTKTIGNGHSGSSSGLIECDCQSEVAEATNTIATTIVASNNCAGASKSDRIVVAVDDVALKLQLEQRPQLASSNVLGNAKGNNCYNNNNNHTNSNNHYTNDQQTLQRLSDSEFKRRYNNCKRQHTQQQIQKQKLQNNFCKNKGNKAKSSESQERVNCQLDSSTTKTTTQATAAALAAPDSNRTNTQRKQSQNSNNNNNNNSNNNSSEQANDSGDIECDNKIDLQNKMTITTTNAASRKHSRVECGLTVTATPATATTATTTINDEAINASIATATTEIAPNSARTTSNMAGTTTANASASASGSTVATTTTAPLAMAAMQLRNTATSPTPTSRPATPSLTTVIKTTMVKRTPSTESSKTPSPATTPTTPTKSIVTATVKARAYNTVSAKTDRAADEFDAQEAQSISTSLPRTSVKQRIAAFASGNDQQQMRNHDNSIKAQLHKNINNNNNNNNKQNMTTNEAKANAINSEHYKATAVISGNKCTNGGTEAATATATATVPAASSSTISSSATALDLEIASTIANNNTAHQVPRTACSTGYATMPRRNLNGSNSIGNGVKCGTGLSGSGGGGGGGGSFNQNGSAAMMTADKTTPSDAAMAADNCRKLAATLDNLDLAVVRDLTDDDGEDSYAAFQEYLERVEHEINEVFEERRARQRALQIQEQVESNAIDGHNAVAPNDAIINNCYINGNNNANNYSDNRLSQCDIVDGPMSTSTTSNMTEIARQHATSNGIANKNSVTPTTAAAGKRDLSPRCRTTTELKALPPPPLSPTVGNELARNQQEYSASIDGSSSEKTSTGTAATSAATQEDVNIWANKFLRDLDNLMSSTRPLSLSACSSPTSKTSPQLLSAAATAAIQSRYGRCATERTEHCVANGLVVLRPEKHATIPLQSFNLDCGRLDNGINADNINSNSNSNSSSTSSANGGLATKPTVAYMRTLSAPTPYHQQQQQQQLMHELVGKSQATTAYCGGKGNRNSLATFNATTEQHQHYHNLTNLQCGNDAPATSALTAAATTATATAKTSSPTTATILKIEETTLAARKAAASTSGHRRPVMAMTILNGCVAAAAAAQETDEESLKLRRQRQLENDMETMRAAATTAAAATTTHWTHRESHSQSQSQSQSQHQHQQQQHQQQQHQLVNGDKGDNGGGHISSSSGLAAMLTIPKRERINHPTMTTPTSAITTTKLGNNTVLQPSTLLTSSASKSNGGGVGATASLLLNGNDVTKKGSTSTIWTSEESILRSVGAVDEDNNSTSSSACEEASGVLSSGKSGISLDSSGLDNDNNESGIGTATPPKDISYWKNPNNDNESISSLDALRKMKFQKSSSVASSDDPDLLEVLSLCDEPHGGGGDEDIGINGGDESHDDIDDQRQLQRPPTATPAAEKLKNKVQQQHQQQLQHQLLRSARQRHRQHQRTRQDDSDNVDSNDALETAEAADDGVVDGADLADEYDEGHDEFEVVPYYECECNDGDASSASGSGGGGSRSGSISANDTAGSNSVVLRRKLSAATTTTTTTPIMMPYGGGGRAQKCRSHSLDTSSLPAVYYQYSPLQHQHPQQHHPLTRKLHQHLHGRGRERGQLSLALRQEPFQSLLSPSHFAELPSPSSASLHSGHESLGIQELTTKSNSAPLLLKQEKTRRDDFAGQKLTLRYSRSQSDRYLAEIEAVEACKWLRAAGFPQYAQMYEDHQFPLDLTNVAKDHTNLENDQLQSLYRRLCILNRCANMRLDQSHKAQTPQKEDSDDENCALSENWTFQPHIRRWSRIGEMGLELPPAGMLNIEKTESSSKESSPDRFEDDTYDISGGGLSLTLPGNSTDSACNESADSAAVRLRRTGSERFKDGAKALLRRVESIKSRRRKRQNREGIVISGPQALDLSQLGQRGSLRKPDAVYSTPPSPSAVSPMHTFPKPPIFGNELKVPSQSESFLSPNRASPKRTPTTPRSMRTSPLHFFSNPMPHLKEGKSDDSSSYYSDSQESSAGGKLSLRKTPSKTRRFLQRTGKVDDIGAHSDSECHHGRKLLIKDANSNTTEMKVKKLTRGGSLNLGKDPKKRDGLRTASFRSRSTSRKESKPEETENVKRSTPVVRWHSFQMEERPQMIFRKCFSQKIDPNMNDLGIPFVAMSAGQLHILRKLALVVLTGYMERYCPTHRSGWNWELPKFIKKIKMPDYKDKKVFGVPLLLVLQRTGQTLPVAIRAAFRWLQVRALDQIGLFRKSGVKSRIIKLKSEVEQLDSTALCMEVYDTQQAYDVADMLKQYFRDLPESLLTTKMSETFAAIFQHLPKDVRLEAVQCAVLLLPDENREILHALLEFLTLVAANAEQNQMTANNLAVCLAPSLFHSTIPTGVASVSASPRRRKGAGVPDDKELQEAKASHECLAFMIENYKRIFTANKEKISKCNFGYMEESKPVPLEALGEGMQFHNWRGYLYECTSATIKEGREKTRGWFTISSQNDSNVDIAYKKVGDGHPLRLWRCTTEVEGPPKEVLDYIIKQRASWDSNLLESQTVKKLDERTEIFQYAIDGQFTTDFCVLRSWQTDLPRGACVIVETSIDHTKAKPMFGAIRGVVLASRYLIEPCGSGRSRVMHLARVDVKGRTPEWYNKSYGHICSHYLSKIRLAFKHVAEGPESKV